MAVQKQPKVLDSIPLSTGLVGPVTGANAQACNVITDSLSLRKDGRENLVDAFFKANHTLLAPGPGLDAMNRTALRCVSRSLDTLSEGTSPARIDLVEWTRHEVTMASCEGAYGPDHIMRDPKVEEAFWSASRREADPSLSF